MKAMSLPSGESAGEMFWQVRLRKLVGLPDFRIEQVDAVLLLGLFLRPQHDHSARRRRECSCESARTWFR